MNNMFSYCAQIKNLDITNFNTENCNSFNDVFKDCFELTVHIKREHNTKFIEQIPEYVKVIIE
jgi:surface protein